MSRRAGLALSLVAVLTLFGCSTASSPSGPPQPTGAVTSASAHPPAPPTDEVWLGAWAQPQTWTTAGRLSAVTTLEAQLSRPLDLVHTYHGWAEPFPTPAEAAWLNQGRRLMISWAGADTEAIAAGTYDDQIRAQADQLRDLDQPVLLRWRWEMNRPNLAGEVHDPQAYVAAWRRIHTIFEQEGATNVGWVWCPLARDFDTTAGADYYPGNDQVDWLCADVYAGPATRSFDAVSRPFRTWAAGVGGGKPVMIGELGAQYAGPAQRRAWWVHAVDTITGWPQVRGVVLFDSRGSAEEPFNLSLNDDPALLATVRRLASAPPFAVPSPGATGSG
jgi:hypothetical protein